MRTPIEQLKPSERMTGISEPDKDKDKEGML
jgi:hypothetical protein